MKKDPNKTSATKGSLARIPKAVTIIVGSIVVLLLLVVIASFFIDEPLRRYTEKKVNKNLRGYTVRIPELSLHPLTLSVTIGGLSLTQDKHPEPPIARFRRIDAGIHWRSIFSGMLVAEMEVDKPVLHVNLDQLKEEQKAPEPVRKKDWQQAVQALYPLKVHTFEIRDADVTYVDTQLKKGVRITNLNVGASNIRNRASPENQFPSPVHVDATIFDSGKANLKGSLNFLAEPLPTGKAEFTLEGVNLAPLKPIAARSNVDVDSGTLSVKGNVLYAPKEKIANIDYLTIDRLKVDYIQKGITAVTKKKEEKPEGLKKMEEVQNKPGLLLRLARLEMKNCEVGLINKQSVPSYRVFMSDLDMLLTNLSNKFAQGPAKLNLTGKFMGSGTTKMTANFRPEKEGPDFDVNIAIANTEMKSMNDLLRAYGNFDVVAGKFSFYSELRLKNDRVDGYVKPLFRDLNVYDRRQDKEKGLFRKMYEGLVGGIAGLLENEPREAVATKTDVSGPVEQPKANTWQALINLLRNAFIKAILPGFEQEVRRKK